VAKKSREVIAVLGAILVCASRFFFLTLQTEHPVFLKKKVPPSLAELFNFERCQNRLR